MSWFRALVVVMLASVSAHADPKRVLVADPDVELVHAIESTLQPWKMVVVAETSAVDPSLVATRAVTANAQFIVWRDQSELVVYDRERNVTERRPARPGPMDPVSAASAALTVKTMMRLPDPEPEAAVPAGTTTAVTAVAPLATNETDVVRIVAGVGVDTRATPRGMFAARFRPTDLPLRVGAAFELSGQTVNQAGFKGQADEYALLAMASWVVPAGSFELEPWIAAGVTIDTIDGRHGQEMRHETATLVTARAGASFWWWHRLDWGVGVTASATFLAGTPTYTRGPNDAVIYEVPAVAGIVGVVAAWRR